MTSRREFLSGCVSACVGVGLGSQVFVTDKTPDVDWEGVDELLEMFAETKIDFLEDDFNAELYAQMREWEESVHAELNRRVQTGEEITDDLWDAYGQCGGPELYAWEHDPKTREKVRAEIDAAWLKGTGLPYESHPA